MNWRGRIMRALEALEDGDITLAYLILSDLLDEAAAA